ncbi:tetratricopeptide repeat protein [Mariprofundus ferrooxydans]|uniref:Tetratricopeptide TPR_4 n=1 Tax=Mariprofundus ferrooxydans PV-1 TaxID=314345 RepID=Q0F1Z8_9PROT|nr:tetratricopeptide repeat protein [Mariprofundus ferrooxydans]EAU55752.1 Tetratricopeptide TPR_4 [Mariprofundus ferrooxydans PV-1]
MARKTRKKTPPPRKVIHRPPQPPQTQINAIAQRLNSGDLETAEKLAQSLARSFPGHAHSWTMLGIVLAQMGRVAESLTPLQKAVNLMPGDSGPHSNLGNALLQLGRLQEAEACYRKAIAVNPNDPDSHYKLGNVLSSLERLPEAEVIYRRLLTLLPENDAAKLAYVQCVALMRFKSYGPFLYKTVAQALNDAWLRPTDLVGVACNLLTINPLIAPYLQQTDMPHHQVRPINQLCEGNTLAEIGNDPLYKALLRSVPVYDENLEQWLTDARQMLLNAANATTNPLQTSWFSFFGPLAEQCFINDYLFYCSADEIQTASALKDALITTLEKEPEEVSPLRLIAVASYFPLYSIAGSHKLLERQWPDAIQRLLIQQIKEPREEIALRPSITSLTPVENEVSLAVQAQYEESPYPRWVKLPAAIEPVAINTYLHSLFPGVVIEPIENMMQPDLLVAGCGTGQHPIETARLIRNASVLAVDLSLASLSYAERKAREMGIQNIEFARADILKLGSLDRTFDIIESVGVLHHLDRPEEGWKVLVSMLRPNGVMRLGFYSEVARRHVVKARELIAQRNFAATADGIRKARPYLREVDRNQTLGCAVRSTDFYSLSACRDLLFHVQEHRLTLAQIQQFIDENGLTFLGFTAEPMTIRAYHTRFPDDPTATNLENWAIYEQENPDAFFDMYQFWLQKRP